MYIGKKRIIVFMVLACLITWLFWVIQSILGITELEEPLGYILITLSVLGPAFAALIVLYKKIPLRNYIKHCFTFEQKPFIYAVFAAFFIWRFILMIVVGTHIEGAALYLPILLIPLCFLTGGNEEFGWRGLLQPQMEKKMKAVTVAFIFAAYWTIWHLPLFFLPIDPRSPIEIFFLLGFFLTNAFSMAAIYKITNSVLLCVLYHAWGNALTNAFSLGLSWQVITGFTVEWLIAMGLLILCEKGMIKTAKERLWQPENEIQELS